MEDFLGLAMSMELVELDKICFELNLWGAWELDKGLGEEEGLETRNWELP